jgi:hypothetical protein
MTALAIVGKGLHAGERRRLLRQRHAAGQEQNSGK